MTDQPTPEQILSRMLAALPQSEHGSLICGAGSTEIRATAVLDDAWLREQIRLRGLIWGIDDPFILGTLWWYSASNWLALPMIASSFLTGTALSARLDDVLLHHQGDSRIPGARSTRLAEGDGTAELADALGAAIDRVAAIAGKGERRLWSVAVDAIAGRYLWAGRATGRVTEATEAAQEVVARLPRSLPVPRFTEVELAGVGGNRLRETFVRRGSCCLLYQVDDKDKCSTCPRQRPAERLTRLEEVTRRRAG
ncbi:FhuF-like iron-sulfur protein [Antricoccus suffuscus]|uniref:FhuF-like iron-sulfur protein n=1 Tax=Antricoccus suffuscus TaxID=1629062 RepID=A0A2T0ZVU8_9ACTN|nr:(2Fe-2S)-binding protein [Antricoccus suffuscus]PRZ40486.1 FhuF-like iron-sulfur protein [Antricoccus suffuscus]